MATPNQMPSKNKIRQQLLSNLIETKPTSWNKKVWNDEKKTVDEVKVTHQGLRYPLAQNVSEQAVESAAKRWA